MSLLKSALVVTELTPKSHHELICIMRKYIYKTLDYKATMDFKFGKRGKVISINIVKALFNMELWRLNVYLGYPIDLKQDV